MAKCCRNAKVSVRACPYALPRMFYVYVLESALDKCHYIGSTNNLRRRFKEHNDGKVFATKSRCPFILLYYEAYITEKLARNRESQLKLRGQARVQLFKRIK